MEYKGIVQTVVETPTYLAIANNLFSEGERANIVALVAAHPGMWGCDAGNGWIPKTSGRPQTWERAEVLASCISGAMNNFRFFSSRFSRKTRRKTYRWQNAMP